uniref:Uncharacterized protein n=1 Tax=Meloidogyne incognita TaxID=6306 RepID=A0A914KHT1_MELIC
MVKKHKKLFLANIYFIKNVFNNCKKKDKICPLCRGEIKNVKMIEMNKKELTVI